MNTKQALEILDIIKRCPFVLERIYELDNNEEYNNRYFFGTISDSELQKVREWLTQK